MIPYCFEHIHITDVDWGLRAWGAVGDGSWGMVVGYFLLSDVLFPGLPWMLDKNPLLSKNSLLQKAVLVAVYILHRRILGRPKLSFAPRIHKLSAVSCVQNRRGLLPSQPL